MGRMLEAAFQRKMHIVLNEGSPVDVAHSVLLLRLGEVVAKDELVFDRFDGQRRGASNDGRFPKTEIRSRYERR